MVSTNSYYAYFVLNKLITNGEERGTIYNKETLIKGINVAIENCNELPKEEKDICLPAYKKALQIVNENSYADVKNLAKENVNTSDKEFLK